MAAKLPDNAYKKKSVEDIVKDGLPNELLISKVNMDSDEQE